MPEIDSKAYFDRVVGGLQGKRAGCTLVSQIPAQKLGLPVAFYDPIPGQAAPSDELDLMALSLACVQASGSSVNSFELAEARVRSCTYRWGAYGFAMRLLRSGLRPPVSGAHDNPYSQCSLARQRAELWGLIAPGAPQLAAELAYRDAIVDHSGDGVHAAMAWAAFISAAAAGCKTAEGLEIAAQVVPPMSRCGEALWWAAKLRRDIKHVQDAWERFRQEMSPKSPWDAAANLGACALAVRFADGDFGSAVTAAASMAQSDFEGNAGSAGTALGVMVGAAALPARWIEPLGHTLAPGWGLTLDSYPASVEDFARSIESTARRILAEKAPEITWGGAATTAAENLAPPEGISALAAELGAAPAPESPAAEEPSPQAIEEDDTPTVPDAITPEVAAGAEAVSAPPSSPEQPDSVAVVSEVPAPEPDPLAALEASLQGAAAPSPSSKTLPVHSETLHQLAAQSSSRSMVRGQGWIVEIDFGEAGPSALPGAAQSMIVQLYNRGEATLDCEVLIHAPNNWQVAVPGAQGPRQMVEPSRYVRLGYVVRPNADFDVHAVNPFELVVTPAGLPATTIPFALMGGQVWHWVGPFKSVSDEGFAKAYEPEDKPGLKEKYLSRSGGLISWERGAFRSIFPPVERLLGGLPGVVYLKGRYYSSKQQEVKLILASNDGVRLWVNGQAIYKDHSHRPFQPALTADDGLAVTLREGFNEVLVKVVRCTAEAHLLVALAPDQDDELGICGPFGVE